MGEYDHAMKSLVDAGPLALARFILSQNEHTRYLIEADQDLRLVGQLNTEFPGTEARADGLLLLEYGPGKPFLVHIEFQATGPADKRRGKSYTSKGYLRRATASQTLRSTAYRADDRGLAARRYRSGMAQEGVSENARSVQRLTRLPMDD